MKRLQLVAALAVFLVSGFAFAYDKGPVNENPNGTHDHDPVLVAHDHPSDLQIETGNGWYFGGALGASNSDFTGTRPVEDDYYACASTYGNDCQERRRGRNDTENYRDDENELAFRIYGGKEDIFGFLNDRLRVGAELGYANLGDFTGNIETDAVDLSATLRFGIGKGFELLGRAGAAYWDAVDDDIDLVGAIGITKDLGSLRARLEYTEYSDVQGEDVEAVFLGLAHRF